MTGPAVYSNEEFDSLFGDVFGSSAGGPLSELDRARLGTSSGRAAVNAENIYANMERLKELSGRVSPAQKARIQKLIKNLEGQLEGWTRPKTEDRIPGSNLARGVAAGVTTTGTGAADLALGATSLATHVVDAALPGQPLQGARDLISRGRSALQENIATNREVIDPQGGAGLAGELTGGIVAGAPVYGPIARGSALALARIAPGLRPLLTGAIAGGPVKQRAVSAAGNVVAGLPLNILQGATMESGRSGAAQTAIGVGADAIFGALMPGAQLPTRPGASVEAPRAQQELGAREAEATAIRQKAETQAAERKNAGKLALEAKKEWIKAHPDEDWNDLSTNQKKKIKDAYVASKTPAPEVVEPSTSTKAPKEATPDQIKTIRSNLAKYTKDLETNPNDPDAQGMVSVLTELSKRHDPEFGKPPVAEAPMGKSAKAAIEAAAAPETKPEVKEVIQKIRLRKEFEKEGIAFDQTKSIDLLQDELSAHKAAKNSAVPVDQQVKELLEARPALLARAGESAAHKQALDWIDGEIAKLGGTVPTEATLPPTDPAQSIVGHPDAMAGVSGGAKPHITSVMDDAGFEDYATAMIGQYLDPNGKPRGFVPTTPELERLYAEATKRGIDLVDVRKESQKVTLPSGIEAVGPSGDIPPSPAPNSAPRTAAGTAPESSPTPAVAPSVKKPKSKPVRGISATKDFSTKELHKLDDQVLAELDAMAKAGDTSSPEYKAKLKEMEEITNELNAREEVEEITAAPDRPYESMEANALLEQRDRLAAQVEAAGKKVPLELQQELEATNREINGRKIGIFEDPTKPKVAPVSATKPVAVVEEPVIEAPPIDPKILNKSPRQLSAEDLPKVIDHINKRLDTETDPDSARFLQTKLAKYLEEQTHRQSKPSGPLGMPPTTDGLKLMVHPAVGIFSGMEAIGWMGGTPDVMSNVFMWGLGSAGIYKGAKYVIARRKAMKAPKMSNLLPGRNQFKQVVRDISEIENKNITYLEYLRKGYQGIVRGTYGFNEFMAGIGRQSVSAEVNVAKLGAMMGRYIARTERFLTSTGRLTYEVDGEPVAITNETFAQLGLKVDPETGPAPITLASVLEMAEGDKAALGDLAVAYASLEGAGRGKVPMPLEQAEFFVRNADPKLRLAVKELRKYNLALMVAAHKAGRISLEGLRAMGEEDWYTPFYRVAKQLDTLRGGTDPKTLKQPEGGIKSRKGGGTLEVLNPYDVAVETTRRVLRSNEYGQILHSFIDQVNALPSSIRSQIMTPVTGNASPKVNAISQAAKNLKDQMKISESDAKSMLAYVDGGSHYTGNGNVRDSIIHVYEDGQLKAYRLHRPEIFEALKSLTPTEHDLAIRLIGMPARTASKGTVYNPIFIAKMAFIDSFQAFLGSKYGFRPGIDQLRGFFHAMLRTDKYKKLLDVGGPATIQSLSYIDPASASSAARTGGERALNTALNNLKELRVVEAYKAIALPIAESARVGEYLRALDHGASTLEAAYAAWDVVGNPRMQGSFATVRALHQITMFSRPALSAMDKLVTELGIGPVAPEYNKTIAGRTMQKLEVNPRIGAALTLMTKGIVGITLPSLLLWYAQKDDEEIRKLRQTSTGSMFWFVRGQDGNILKIRKPHIIGEFFGTSAEAWADNEARQDPENLMRVLDGMFQDASVNVLPQMGVITMGLWANKTPSLNTAIVAEREGQLEPFLQGYDKASVTARLIGDALAPVSSTMRSETLRRAMSPAGIDYLTRNLSGMLGEDGMRLVGSAIEYSRMGFLPPAEEAPLISRLFAKYPAMNVEPIRTFYARDQKVTTVAKTLDRLQMERPELFADYWMENQEYIQVIETHKDTRQAIANYRRAIDDLRAMPETVGNREIQRKVEQAMVKAIEQETETANLIFRAGVKPK